MKVALYARVSKAEDQTPENQLIQLRQWAANSKVDVIGEFVEAVSSRDTRPIKEDLKRKARLGEIDAIAFVSLDRWGREMSELVLDIEEFTKRGVQLISLKEGLRFDSAAGQLYAHMLAAFANFERERIRERTLAGLARAKAQGKHLGRPRKTPPANPDELLEESLVQLKNVRFYTSADAMYAHIAEWNYLRAKFLAKSDYTCSSCKKRYKNETSFLYMDHILPIADGGLAFDEANLQVLCGRCHAEKSSSEASIRNKKLYEKSKLQIS